MELRDTSPAAMEQYTALLRQQLPYQRLAQAVALSQNVRELTMAGIRQRHPDASDNELRVRLAVRLYGRETATKLLGDIPADAV
jgi:hypothetical protein